MSAALKNSSFGASTGGVTASAAAPTTQTGTRSAGDMAPPVASQATAPATVKSHVTVGIVRLQSNAGYANANRPRAYAEDAGVTSPGGEQPGTHSPRAGMIRPSAETVNGFCVSTRGLGASPSRLVGASVARRAGIQRSLAGLPHWTGRGHRAPALFPSRDRRRRQAADHASVLRASSNLHLHNSVSRPCFSINTDRFDDVQILFAEDASARR